jgi:hypothetical protein
MLEELLRIVLRFFLGLTVFSVALVGTLWGLYQFVPAFHKWANEAWIFPAVASSRKGEWVKDPSYWEYVSPKDRIAPRGCDAAGRPPFDRRSVSSSVDDAKHSHQRQRTSLHHRRGLDNEHSMVPKLIPV